MIDRYSPEKIYMQIISAIEADIQDVFEPGDLYLSEKVLTEKFGVNRHTVRRAVEELVKQGVLEKRHGFGTFVAEKRLAYRIKGHQRLTEAVEANGLSVETTVLSKRTILARGSIAENLQLKNGEEVIQVNTLRKIDNKELALISHFLPKAFCPEVLESYESGSLGSFLINVYGIKAKRISSLVSSAMPNASDNFQLGMMGSQPILKVKTLNKDDVSGKIIEYSVSRFRSDMIQLEILINPEQP